MSRPLLRGLIFDMDGTLTCKLILNYVINFALVPIIDFKMMKQRVGVPENSDVLSEISKMEPQQKLKGILFLIELLIINLLFQRWKLLQKLN